MRPLLFLLHLGAEVEGDDGGHHDHHVIGGDGALEGQGGEHRHHRQGHDGLHLNQRREILKKVQIAHPLSIYGILPNR